MSVIVNGKEYASEKNAQIALTRNNTRKRRETQVCKVYNLKIDMSKLTQKQEEALKGTFLEAKWIYNAALNTEKPTSYLPGKTVEVKNRDGDFETRDLQYIGSQVKQSVISGIGSSLSSLKAKKKKGYKVGKLKFTRRVKSVDLKQHGTTYRLFPENDKVRVQGVPGKMKVYGIHQISEHAELANAKLIQKSSGYYLKITTYLPKDDDVLVDDYVPGTVEGIDMGVATHITFSNGVKISTTVVEPPRLKRLQRKLDRQYKRAEKLQKSQGLNYLPFSQNYYDTLEELRKEYEKLDNKKDNLAKQIVSVIMKNEIVFFQDEMITSWKKWFGRELHHSVLGRVKALLKAHPRAVMIPQSEPTTQWCRHCEQKTKHDLNDRVYTCQYCEYSEDRDVHAADNMIWFGQSVLENNVPMERRELTPVLVDQYLKLFPLGCTIKYTERVIDLSELESRTPGTSPSLKQETNSSSVSW